LVLLFSPISHRSEFDEFLGAVVGEAGQAGRPACSALGTRVDIFDEIDEIGEREIR
jgi:hypothetical protein